MDGDLLKQFRDEQKITTIDARTNLSETINRVHYGKERMLLFRLGKPIAVIIPIGDLEYLRSTQPRAEHFVTTLTARTNFSEAYNIPFYAQKRVIVTRRQKELAAIVSLEELNLLSQKPDDPEPMHRPREGRRFGLDGKPLQ